MARKRVLFIISSLIFGGAEKHTISLVNHLDTSKFETFLCYLKREEDLINDLNEQSLSGLFCLDKRNRIDLSVLQKLRKTINLICPEIVVCINPYPALYAQVTRALFSKSFKLVLIMHSTILRNMYEEVVTRTVYKKVINASDKVVFVCKNQMNHWIQRYAIRKDLSKYIYNGIDINHYDQRHFNTSGREMRESLGIKQSELVVCISGALHSGKRHVHLLDAGNILKKRGILVKILIVGDGDERNSIEKHIAQIGLKKDVIITGFQSDVRPYISLSDIVVNSSAAETFSIAILEAMALGKPIIASDIGGASEQIIHGENGFLFLPGDVESLADSIETLISQNLFEVMGVASRKRVCERFTLDQMVQQYEELLLQ